MRSKPTTTTPTRTEQLHSLASTLRKVRLFCVVFAAMQFLIYQGPSDVQVPHPVGPWGVAVVAWLLLTNAVSKRSSRKHPALTTARAGVDVRAMERAAALEIALDATLVLFLVWLLSFDQVGAEWGLLNIVVLEAALRLDIRGAIACWTLTTAPYVALQAWAAAHYPHVVLRPNVVTFQMGMVLTVALIGGGLASQLQRQLEASRGSREEADERARLLRIAAEAGRSMASLGSDSVLDSVTTAALQLGFDAADVCVLDVAAGTWRVERAVNMPAGFRERGHAADSGVSALVRQEGRTVVIDDYLGWEGGVPEVREGGFTTVVGLPVRVGGEVIATLGVGTRRHRPISPAELECLELLAAQASAALDVATRQTETRDLHEMLSHSASHDRLTGLPNREQLLARLTEVMTGDGEVAVVVCDLDGFKTLNDSLGHQAGDQILCAVAQRLISTAGDRLVARLSGDEFAIVVERGGIETGSRLARMLLLDFRDPLDVEGNALAVSLSIGVAAGDQSPAPEAVSLLRDAGLAMERAKQSGRSRSQLFDPSLRLRAQQRLSTESDLRAALGDGSITVAYQPMVSLDTGAILGVEALARWTHPTRGAISPAEFIRLAEETGLIHQLGVHVLDVACRQGQAWHRDGDLRLSVNISAVQLASDRCAESVATVLHATGFPADHLTLEITESAVMDSVPEVLRSVHALAALGVLLSVDDLGQGWSSLAYLTRYPLSQLKIDRSFVEGVARRPADGAVVRALVGLGHDLGLTVVAEGIEDADQLAELARLGCDLGQGFYLHRPLTASGITDLVAGGASLRGSLPLADESGRRR